MHTHVDVQRWTIDLPSEVALGSIAGIGPWLATARRLSSRWLAWPRHLTPTTSWLVGSPRGSATWGLNAVNHAACEPSSCTRFGQLFLKAVVFSRKNLRPSLPTITMNEWRTTEATWIPDTGRGNTARVFFQFGIKSKYKQKSRRQAFKPSEFQALKLYVLPHLLKAASGNVLSSCVGWSDLFDDLATKTGTAVRRVRTTLITQADWRAIRWDSAVSVYKRNLSRSYGTRVESGRASQM
ncbi:hypothetical protein C8J57DRAFT_1214149 [Mycena rebaudengoi]|nr:hypothetical protein C8J57DRAFT_1214149 [Mycena rebaudengoi]